MKKVNHPKKKLVIKVRRLAKIETTGRAWGTSPGPDLR